MNISVKKSRMTARQSHSLQKLTAFLYRRFTLGLPGFLVLPCELIDDNASLLREYVLKYAVLWELGENFERWLREENIFCNTLVDRITPGFPKDDENIETLLENCGGDALKHNRTFLSLGYRR